MADTATATGKAADPAAAAETVTVTDAADTSASAEDLLAELGGPSKFWRWVGTPLMLTGVVVALYFWVQGYNVTHRIGLPSLTLNLPFDYVFRFSSDYVVQFKPPKLPFLDYAGKELSNVAQRSINADQIGERIGQHLQLSFVSTFFVILIAVPLGMMLTRPGLRRLSPAFLGVANIGQAVPSYGVLVLLAISFGIGFRYAIYALVIYAVLPVLRNTMVGIDQVDPALIEAGRGMGLTSLQVLRRVEVPLAVPVMLAGIRTALIINVGTATLATYINAGGLGWIIDQGLRNRNLAPEILVVGSVLTAVLALALDWLAGVVEDLLRPKGL